VILTEPRPAQALGLVLRRLAYLVLPASVLFVRYYPEYGRTFHFGVPLYTGVGHQKNALGQMCLVTGIYFAWQVLADRENFKAWSIARRLRLWALVAMALYLIDLSDSKTSLACLLLASSVLWCARMGFVRRQPTRLLAVISIVALLALFAEWVFGVREAVLLALDRDPGLTNRIDLWALLLPFNTSPLLGAGFMGFWTGERMQDIWVLLGAGVLQAHSGYIEQYLNLGYVGVAFIVALLLKGFLDARAHALEDPAFSALRLTLMLAALAYNYTEAAFYGINNMWLLLLVALINAPAPALRGAVEPAAAGLREPIEMNGMDNAATRPR
jgi:exopolysaccharide production protein ExoQ